MFASLVLTLWALSTLCSPAPAVAAVDAGNQLPNVEELLARARVELARPARPDKEAAAENIARVEGWLRRAIVLAPAHYAAHLLLADVILREGRAVDAVAAFEAACALARGSAEVFPCSLRMAEAQAQAGQYQEALREYTRHLEIGDPQVVPFVLVRSAELQMALGRLAEAENGFARATSRLMQAPTAHEQQAMLARSLYGQAVVFDRSGRDREMRQSMWRAIAIDPSLAVLDPGHAESEWPFLPSGEVNYYRGLGLLVLGETRAAMVAFKKFLDSAAAETCRKGAEDHLLALAAAGADLPLARPRKGRVVAEATVDAQGPLPAPLIDAAWKSRPRLLDPCVAELPQGAPRIMRLALSLEIDGQGVPRRAKVELGLDAAFGVRSDWHKLAICVEKRVEAGLRTVHAANKRRTSARIELVLAIGGQP